MQLAASGDENAFRQLTRSAMPQALRVARNVLLSESEAEDVVQEAFMRAWRHKARYDPKRARFSTWLYRIVVNLAIDRRRSGRKLVTLDCASHVQDERPDSENSLIDRQRQLQVRNAIAKLPERQRTAVSLFYLQGFSSREAADIMETNDVAFQQLLARARAALKTKVFGSEWEFK